MKYLICNLKSNLNLNEILDYVEKMNEIALANLVICPPVVYLPYFLEKNFQVGSQDLSKFSKGNYTGEIFASQLQSLEVKYTLVGHSERRKNLNENEETLVLKIRNALDSGLKVIYCIGETKEENLRKKTYIVIESQLARVLNEFTREELKNIIVAYEPIWAIGTGEVPSSKVIDEIISFIKKLMKEYYELDTEVLYGGSVDDKNIDNFKEMSNVDGFLIGGSSLYPEKIRNIIESVK